MDSSPASPSSTSSSSPSVSGSHAGAAPAPQQPGTASRRRWGSRGLRPVTLGVAALVVIVDQFTKWLVINHVNEPIHLFWTLQLVKAYNTGTAFSLGIGLGPFIGLLAVVVVLLLARMGRAVVNPAGVVALGMVMGGAVGNLTDRLLRESHGFMHGAVVDFIDLQWWPVFNVADTAIVIGGFLLAFSGFGEHRVAPSARSGGAGSGAGTSRPAGGPGQGTSTGPSGAAE